MKWIGRLVLITLLVSVVFVAGAIWHMPAAFLVDQARVQAPQVFRQFQLSGTRGTVWNGRTLLSVQGQVLDLDWHIRPLGAISGAVPVSLRVEGDALNLSGDAAFRFDQSVEAELSGAIALSVLDDVLKRQGIEVPGAVRLSGLSTRVLPQQQWLAETRGKLAWPGGTVSFPVGQELETRDVPALEGDLTQEDNELWLRIRQKGLPDLLMDIRVTPDQRAFVQVRRRLLDVVDMPWSERSAPDDVIFKVQQRLGR